MGFADYLLRRCLLRRSKVRSVDQTSASQVPQEVPEVVVTESHEGNEADTQTSNDGPENKREDSFTTFSPVNLPIVETPHQHEMDGVEHSSPIHRVDSSDSNDDIVLEEEQKNTTNTTIPLKHGPMLSSDGQDYENNNNNNNNNDSYHGLVECSARSSNIVRLSLATTMPLNRWTGVDPDGDEFTWTGSTLDEPMTPQSYSSMYMLNEFNPMNRSTATGNARNSCTSDTLFQGCHRQDARYGNCALTRSAVSLRSPRNTFGKQSGEFQGSGAIKASSAVPEHGPRDSGKPPLCCTVYGPTESASHSTTSNLTNLCVGSEAHSAKEKFGLKTPTNADSCPFPCHEPISFWPLDLLPPEPKELVSVNVGRTPSHLFKKKVVEVSYAHERVIGKYQHMLNDKYVIYPRWNLGVGSYSEVMLCYNLEDKVYYAMKVMDRARLQRKALGVDSPLHRVKCEVAIMKKLRHDNILAVVEVIDDPRSRKIYLVLELAERGEIMSMKNDGTVLPTGDRAALNEQDVIRAMRSIVSAAMYAHHLGIAHRDIKPQNIVLTAEGDAKLSDFGVSIMVGDSAVRVRREGTVAFLPPEMLVSSEFQAAPLCPRRFSSYNSSIGNRTRMVPAMTLSCLTQEVHRGISNVFSTSLKSDLFRESCNSAETEVHSAATPPYSPEGPTRVNVRSPTAGLEAIPQVNLFKADVFSLGVTAYVLLMGQLPWRARDARSQLQAILSKPDPFAVELRNDCGDSEDGRKSQRKSRGEVDSQLCLNNDAPLGSAKTMCGQCPTLLDSQEEMRVSRDGMFQVLDTNNVRAVGVENPGGCWSFTSLLLPEEVTGHSGLDGSLLGCANSSECETGKNSLPNAKPKSHLAMIVSSDTSCTWDARETSKLNNLANGDTTATHVGRNLVEQTHKFVSPADRSFTESGGEAAHPLVSDSLTHCGHAAEGQVNSTPTRSLTTQVGMEMTRTFQQTDFDTVDTAEASTDAAKALTTKKITAATPLYSDADRSQPSLPVTNTNGSISANAIDFISRCLNVDPAKRSSMEELYYHPWLQGPIASDGKAKDPVDVALPPPFSDDLSSGTPNVRHTRSDTSMSNLVPGVD
ncbi:putative protein kinase, putative,serine/threonine protein kinase [Trypanosoma rangeli]|uniref:Protein kinase domain-containing protein n=1 Tax=Trypanosoma rangeli TaxID=5698 RepID=A0A422P359_TRYRA|nr:putative protein kinase, putative,serine/threonine protein kinase [Trypanosoma rangeli]RNF12167.1 putative protein kinase, putative,serine/threonine protein kinase [Trypanosoma rangeli]|eukprot:RNF12167.1 putative protein kinase, putative,serine/threonine protein kinase [Trypanosoma rangeli]